MFSREHSTNSISVWVGVVVHTYGGRSATLPVGGGVGPCGGVLIMGRLLGCAVRNVPRFR